MSVSASTESTGVQSTLHERFRVMRDTMATSGIEIRLSRDSEKPRACADAPRTKRRAWINGSFRRGKDVCHFTETIKSCGT